MLNNKRKCVIHEISTTSNFISLAIWCNKPTCKYFKDYKFINFTCPTSSCNFVVLVLIKIKLQSKSCYYQYEWYA